MMAGPPTAGQTAKPPPKDLSHHFSHVTKARQPSKMKEYYKFFQIPGVGQLAGGASLLCPTALPPCRPADICIL